MRDDHRHSERCIERPDESQARPLLEQNARQPVSGGDHLFAADDVEKIDDIAGTHADASVAHGQSDVAFFRRLVNVNIANECIRILWFAPTQPNNARDDWIAAGRIRRRSRQSVADL